MAMRTLSDAELAKIAAIHGIQYQPTTTGTFAPTDTPTPNVVQSMMSRVFRISRPQLYTLLADIHAHSRLFRNIQASVVTPKAALSSVAQDEELAYEQVTEAGPMLAAVKYRFTTDKAIEKHIVTNPFSAVASDKKRGVVNFELEDAEPEGTRLTTRSIFETPAGPTPFVRGLVDHVWLDFFENVMVEFGELQAANKLAG